ncbi:ATP-binding protein [Anaerobacillus sp. MEB173]|uniref:ATP-binding protein n=1 Tax=Anaerobacillus sp. MEB173 TaxID=3383345 RepID=UPI003F8E5185
MYDLSILLINLLLILVSLFFLQLWFERKNRSEKKIKLVSVIVASILIFLCMTFTVNVNEDFNYDLRQVLLWIAGLYGGPVVAIVLLLITVAYRSIIGGLGIIVATIIATTQTTICIALHKKFLSFSSKQRVIWTVTLSTFSGLLTVILIGVVFKAPVELIGFIVFLPLQIIGTLICSLTFELLIRNKQLQREFQKAKKMEVVTHLASSFGHEIRNPMTSAIGFLQLLRQEPSLKCEKQKYYIDIATEELKSAEAIIKDYLLFAKPSINKLEKLDLENEISQSLDVIRPFANMNSVNIVSKVEKAFFLGEHASFQQCIINILKNAIESMPNGGLLKVQGLKRKQVVIRIEDKGVGMTKEQVSRLGEPYFSTKSVKGTGLGMMVSYRVIETLGGNIQVESEVNKGTAVSISLPLLTDEIENNESIVSKIKKII